MKKYLIPIILSVLLATFGLTGISCKSGPKPILFDDGGGGEDHGKGKGNGHHAGGGTYGIQLASLKGH